MKKAFFTLLFTITSLVVFGQVKTNPVLDKFVGSWIAKTGTQEVTIMIKKAGMQLQGNLKYTNNNQVIEDSKSPNLTSGNNISADGKVYQDQAYFYFYDSKKGKTSTMRIELSKTNPNEFTTFLIERSDLAMFAPAARKKLEGFTIPVSLKFKRQ